MATTTTTVVPDQLSLFDGWPKKVQGEEGPPKKVRVGVTIPPPTNIQTSRTFWYNPENARKVTRD